MSYDEHLISMAGGDGETVDHLAAIEARAGHFPSLLVAHSDAGSPASVYEEADGLETICNIPGYYSPEAQNQIADAIVDMQSDRDTLLALVREQQAKLDRVKALADWADEMTKCPCHKFRVSPTEIRAAITATEDGK